MPPTVRWLVDNGDAVRLHIRNQDGAWACALVILRPDWTDGGSTDVAAEGNLRGIWYDSGTSVTDDAGRHDCSPTTVADEDLARGAARHGIPAGTAGNDPLPIDGSQWAIPHDDNLADATRYDDGPNAYDAAGQIPERLLQRTVPEF